MKVGRIELSLMFISTYKQKDQEYECVITDT